MSSGAICTQEGQAQLLTDLIGGGALENWTLRLYTNSHTPAITDTAVSFTEATFTGYAAITLTRSFTAAWGAVSSAGGTAINAGGDAISTYQAGTPRSWTCTAAPQTIYGHFLKGATSTKSILAQLWTAPVVLTTSSVINLTPVLELGAIGG